MKNKENKIKSFSFLIVICFLLFSFSLFSTAIASGTGGGLGSSGIKIGNQSVPEPIQCCQIKHKISIAGEDDFEPGDILAPSDTAYCPYGTIDKSTPNWAGVCALDGFVTAGDVILWVALIVTGVALVFAGIMFVTAAGNPDRVKTAKVIFKYSLIGVLVATLSRFIPAVARYFIGL